VDAAPHHTHTHALLPPTPVHPVFLEEALPEALRLAAQANKDLRRTLPRDYFEVWGGVWRWRAAMRGGMCVCGAGQGVLIAWAAPNQL
jgi:hypothetical protein